MTTSRIGFCCKWLPEASAVSGFTPKQLRDYIAPMNQRSTTIAHLQKLSHQARLTKMIEIVDHNCATLWRQLEWLSGRPEHLRMFRITSDFVPASTFTPLYAYAHHPLVLIALTQGLRGIRKYADANGIRLTMHPSQFTNLCSDNTQVVAKAIEDVNYHAQIAKYMGYGDTWHSSGFAINVHANSRQDPGLKQIRRVIANRLSDEARNLITIENDEYGCGVDELLDAGVQDDVALVLDIHHHWINTKGEYISSSDSRTLAFHDSWRGMRPLGHVSAPSEAIVVQAGVTKLPDYGGLVSAGVSAKDLRRHSSYLWNLEHLEWATQHLAHMDLEVEAKSKNIASDSFYVMAKIRGWLP